MIFQKNLIIFIYESLSLLAQCCRFLGQLEEGVALARKALAKIELYGSYAGKMHTIWVLSELLLEPGDLSSAKPIIGELLKWVETYEDTTARMYGNLVKASSRLLGNLEEALEWAQNGLKAAAANSLVPDLQTGELYTCNEGNCSIDLAEFESLLNLRNVSSHNRIANLLKIEKLYQGDLLEAYLYESFLNPPRERARRLYDELLLELARFYWKKKDFQNGINYFDRLLERNEYAETTYWVLIAQVSLLNE